MYPSDDSYPHNVTVQTALKASLTAGAPDPTGILAAFAATGAHSSQEQISAARAAGEAAGRLAERGRIAAIVNSEGGKLNPIGALAVALDASLADVPAALVVNTLKIGAQSTTPAGRPNSLRRTVEAMVAEDARRAGVPDQASHQASLPSARGLTAAVSEMVARDTRWP